MVAVIWLSRECSSSWLSRASAPVSEEPVLTMPFAVNLSWAMVATASMPWPATSPTTNSASESGSSMALNQSPPTWMPDCAGR